MARRASEALLIVGVFISGVIALTAGQAWPDTCAHEGPLTFEWAPATGSVDSYEVYVAVNGLGFPSSPTAVVDGASTAPAYDFTPEKQNSYRIKVRAVSALAGPGPFSQSSALVWFYPDGTAEDCDGDGLLDAAEAAGGCTSRFDVDTDDDGISDGQEDINHNGQIDPGESNPCQADLVEETVCDDGQACTSHTGTWQVSDATGAYGADSLYGKSGATYTWNFQIPSSGGYHLYMWWTEYASGCTDCPVTLECGGRILDSFTVNQIEDGSQWNWFGRYAAYAGEGCKVTITAEGSASTCADAVKLVSVGGGAECGNGVAETGEQCDGNDAPDCPGLCQDNCTCPQAAEEVCDNGDACTSAKGRWRAAEAGPPYGEDSLVARNWGSYVWTFTMPETGSYRWSMWWTSYKSRSAACPVSVKCGGRLLDGFAVNQQQDGGQWNELGVWPANAGETCTVKLWVVGSETTSADAVKFELQ